MFHISLLKPHGAELKFYSAVEVLFMPILGTCLRSARWCLLSLPQNRSPSGVSSLEQFGAHRDRDTNLHSLLFLIPQTGLSSWQWMEFQQDGKSFIASDKAGLGFSSRRIAGKLGSGDLWLAAGSGDRAASVGQQELGSRVARGASGASPEETGSLTRAVVGQQEQIANWPSTSKKHHLG